MFGYKKLEERIKRLEAIEANTMENTNDHCWVYLLPKTREERIRELEETCKNLQGKLAAAVVENYFKDCPCCNEGEWVNSAAAVSFRKVGAYGVHTHYCTKEAYELHKPRINEWEKEVKEAKKYLKEAKEYQEDDY